MDVRVYSSSQDVYLPEDDISCIVSRARDHVDPEDCAERRHCVVQIFCPILLGYA
jgi:hypothetical protein